jgi:hypothetical protein
MTPEQRRNLPAGNVTGSLLAFRTCPDESAVLGGNQ